MTSSPRPKYRGRLDVGAVAVVLALAVIPSLNGVSAGAAGTPIVGNKQATLGQARAWARSRNAAQIFVDLAEKYWQIAPTRGGVRPEVAYAQAALETGYMKYGGVIESTYHNPCGMKKKGGGPDGAASSHQQYASWDDGITACIDHLALYAGAAGYPLPEGATPDGKQSRSLYGVAPTVEQLGGIWAPSPTYGSHIVSDLLAPLIATPAPPGSEDPPAAEPSPSVVLIPDPPPTPEVVQGIYVAGLRVAGLAAAVVYETG